ncbi:hypothetical protein D7X94_11780 [Acutalibacter sp. 1XD8-33]|nr:hypothetical protein D7X94_11780 [Acutalibacter sp. 1XD8-33]
MDDPENHIFPSKLENRPITKRSVEEWFEALLRITGVYVRTKKRVHGQCLHCFQKRPKEEPGIGVVEMDRAEGRKGGKVLLTMSFRSCDLLLIFLLETHMKMPPVGRL